MAYSEVGRLPQLGHFTHHKTLRNVDFDEIPVPGLDADFYRRPVADRLLSVGVYRFGGAETHRAWGWVGDAHCSWHAYWNPAADRFDGPIPGCPELRLLLTEGRAYGFELGFGGLHRRFLLDGEFLRSGSPTRVDDPRDADRQPDPEPGALEHG
ncbi:hypothetical protein [Glycomyces buryatensis]|uniref:Uncharacterized protein n=1 Tax=Glycomyces buryatensis TaxID=2570927 RepID=A0A4S8Q9N4_9ACTN|nr:hypothetical protein [Glycomyces buryatensis]THV39502.1 hypothetical protein FAB82_18005 [Glycomyces buryatensis]